MAPARECERERERFTSLVTADHTLGSGLMGTLSYMYVHTSPLPSFSPCRSVVSMLSFELFSVDWSIGGRVGFGC